MVSCQERALDVMFAFRMLMGKYREGQKNLHCVFVDLEKAALRAEGGAVVLYEGVWSVGKVY